MERQKKLKWPKLTPYQRVKLMARLALMSVERTGRFYEVLLFSPRAGEEALCEFRTRAEVTTFVCNKWRNSLN